MDFVTNDPELKARRRAENEKMVEDEQALEALCELSDDELTLSTAHLQDLTNRARADYEARRYQPADAEYRMEMWAVNFAPVNFIVKVDGTEVLIIAPAGLLREGTEREVNNLLRLQGALAKVGVPAIYFRKRLYEGDSSLPREESSVSFIFSLTLKGADDATLTCSRNIGRAMKCEREDEFHGTFAEMWEKFMNFSPADYKPFKA